eukprot:jgi/Picsp_1/5080/NSC_02443-R1_---NA---
MRVAAVIAIALLGFACLSTQVNGQQRDPKIDKTLWNPFTGAPDAPKRVEPVSVGATSLVVQWKSGFVRYPKVTFDVLCVDKGDACTGTPFGNGETSVEQKILTHMTGSVTGLQANTTYSCYVAAVNSEGRQCSDAVIVETKL